MKLAVIAITANGARLGKAVGEKMPDQFICAFYEKNGRQGGTNERAVTYDNLRGLLQEVWTSYEGFVFIMSSGIVVREISGFLQHKSLDPAVVVMDERGNNCISLLSGHLGGANRLAKLIAKLMNSNPVITTASDVNDLVVPDSVAEELNYRIDSFTALRQINGCIVAGEKTGFFVDETLPEKEEFIAKAKKFGLPFEVWTDKNPVDDCKGWVFLTEKERELNFSPLLYLRPKSLIAGVGCRRGTPLNVLEAALEQALGEAQYSKKCLCALCSAWLKKDEEGLLQLADKLHIPTCFYETEELQTVIRLNHLQESAFVKEKTGVGNVCEAAALAKVGQTILLKTKKSYGAVTIALARVNFLLPE